MAALFIWKVPMLTTAVTKKFSKKRKDLLGQSHTNGYSLIRTAQRRRPYLDRRSSVVHHRREGFIENIPRRSSSNRHRNVIVASFDIASLSGEESGYRHWKAGIKTQSFRTKIYYADNELI